MLIELITLLILILIAIIGLKLLIENGDTILKIITHLAMGWILGTILLVLLSIIF